MLSVAAVLAVSGVGRAQFVGGPVYAGGYSYRSGFGFSFGGPGFRAGGFVTKSVVAVGPPVFVAPGPVVPAGFVGFGPGPRFGPGFGPPVVAVAVPVPVPVPVAVGMPPEAEPPPKPERNDDKLFPKVNRDDFVVIAPNRNPAERPPAPVPPPAIKPFDPAAVRVDVPAEADPKKEAERRVKLGRATFADGDYGRAAEHFAAATAADPAEPTTYFLHGQAEFAAGRYRDAVARIRDGLARDPKWPQFPFAPVALYSDPKAFAAHVADLKKANADRPGQVTLEFLLGYQLWFSGEKAEADKLFRAAEKRLADPGPIALFKFP
jgi:hypothetical protein